MMKKNVADIEMLPRRASAGRPDDFETDYQPVNWKRVFLAPKYLVCWILLVLVIVATIIITIKHDQVVAALRPFAEKVRDLPAGWLIPIAILIIISFPPLFGHELIALLCGVVWDLWIGFAIVAAGTFLGELGTWFAFQHLLRKKAEKMERTNINYGALARMTRDGGFWIVLIIRFSAIPSHFSTAVFSTCGVNFWAFAIATFVTLPKQIFLVYLGVLLLQNKPDSSAKNIIFGVAFAVTIVMAVYIWWKLNKIKKVLLAEQAERRANKARFQLGQQAGDESEEGQFLMNAAGTEPLHGQDYHAVAQEEVDIGVAGPSGPTAPPKYQSGTEYQSQYHQSGSQYRPYQPGGTSQYQAGHEYPPAGSYPAGPQYQSNFEYQGQGSATRVDLKEPVKEQQWV